ncbi:uncharacterized transporter slc-17.2-like [Octopus bimaculoides]|uniref:uncharacterized transporter slc-17.2-like n=1 Tax=Octopus bimaculoides TaxID=37653 RepID=UPI0022E42A52|nr:uncharacterized transporter slc-17.2-like [Octopus bimaculoides]
MAAVLVQTLRVDISMAFVCMLKTPNRTSEEVNVTTNNQHCSGFDNRSMNQNYEGEFEWSDTLQANVLAGYFYGYVATNSLGGLLADKYGAKRVVGGSILSASILTILHPSLSRISGYLTLILRILTGMASGSIYPAVQSLYGRWAPPQEIGSLVGLTFSGLNLGNIVGLPTSGYLCVYGFDNGWGSIFYIFGGISLVFSCVWFYVVYDTPDVHPTISEKEHSYLNRIITIEKVVKKVPWRRLISSPAVWAISFGWFAYCWTSLSFQVLLPLYMKEALNVNATSNGLMSSASSVAQIIALPLCGNLADFIPTSGSISPLTAKALTPNGTQEEWQIVFALCAAICVVGTILYAILARGEIQDWAISEDSGVSVPLNDMNTNKPA